MTEKTRSIVCIEDEDEIRETIVEILEDEGYDVASATNGRDGLALVLEKRPDIIICDIYMPHMDGFSVCRAFRAAGDANAATPFVFLSALPLDEEKLKEEKVVFNGYLTKPVDFDDLISKIGEFA